VPIEGFCCTTTEGALNVVCGFKKKKNSMLSEKTCLTDTCVILDYSHTDPIFEF